MMVTEWNPSPPLVMHIDLNSCFATAEQQVFYHLRNRPIVVSAYTTGKGFILAPSIEAKRYGIKLGFNNEEARIMCPSLIVRDPDPNLVRDIHVKFKKLFEEYSPYVYPKSIDEAVIFFKNTPYENHDLKKIAEEIRRRIKEEIGDYMKCSIGISTNSYLAKIAAGLHKPNGLDVITSENIETIFSQLKLTDLTGIAEKMKIRLNSAGIYSPTELLRTSREDLQKRVFRSILGYYWYLRFRGWEVDAQQNEQKTFGQQYALGQKTNDFNKISMLVMKLCEKMGRRLRKVQKAAYGIHIACHFDDHTYWHKGVKGKKAMYTTHDFYTEAINLLEENRKGKTITKISITCYDVISQTSFQEDLFGSDTKAQRLSKMMDQINDRYGEFVVSPAIMMKMDNTIIDRIAFGRVRELEDLYE